MPGRASDSRQRNWIWTLLLALLFASCVLDGQTSAEPGSVVISKKVRLVEVEVIARDKHGKLAHGLEARDFTLIDNGHMQKISRFSVEQGTPEAAGDLTAPGVGIQPNQALTFSNTHAANPAPTVILFDRLNTPWDLQPSMQRQLLQLLTHLKPGTSIALLILGDDLTVVSDFTTSTISLANATGKDLAFRPEGLGPPITARATGNAIRDAMVAKSVTKAFRADANERVVRTLAALNIIGARLGDISGRKSLLWLSAGLSVAGELPSVQRAIDKLNDANVGVYTFDSRGVVLAPGSSAENDSNDLTAAAAEQREDVRGDVLAVMAQSTGGIYYRNRNQLESAINEAIEDSKLVYTLDYYPDHNDWQGKFHKLVVKTTRPGVQLRYPSGYLATPPAQPSEQDQQHMLAAIASSPVDFSGIHFAVEIKAGPDPSTPRLVLHVPTSQLQWSADAERMAGALQVWFIQRRASGEDLATSTAKKDWHLTKMRCNRKLRWPRN